jgi:hydrogenase nickel incorporation protein HypA/HybF
MHELSIAISMIEVAGEEARRRGATRVNAVHLRLGPLSGVVKEALLFSYDLACEGTLLDGSRLIIEETPVGVFCYTCEAERTLASMQNLFCPVCENPASDIVRGRELEIVALEIES